MKTVSGWGLLWGHIDDGAAVTVSLCHQLTSSKLLSLYVLLYDVFNWYVMCMPLSLNDDSSYMYVSFSFLQSELGSSGQLCMQGTWMGHLWLYSSIPCPSEANARMSYSYWMLQWLYCVINWITIVSSNRPTGFNLFTHPDHFTVAQHRVYIITFYSVHTVK